MSGPYPPQGYPQQPAQGGWGGQVGGGPSGPYGPANYPGGWPQQQQQPEQPSWNAGPPPEPASWNAGPPPEPTPPPRKRNTGQIITAIVAVLVIVGGVAVGIVLLGNHRAQQQAGPGTTIPVTSPATQQQQGSGQPGASNSSGSTTLTVSAGQCATATTTNGSSSYLVTKSAQCGSTNSDFILNKTVSQVSGCAAQQFVVITGPNGSVYCFTVDVKAGDCVNNYYLKAPCGPNAAFSVLKTEAGPGSASSCRNVVGVQRWVPAGYPAEVACIGPPANS